MQPRTRIGLIVGVIGLVLNICVAGFIGFCGPVLSLIAGGIAGYFATQQESHLQKIKPRGSAQRLGGLQAL